MPDAPAEAAVLESLHSAVALVEPGSWRILFRNARFQEWFPEPNGGPDALPARIPAMDAVRALARFERGRSYRWEAEAGGNPRVVPIRLELRPLPGGSGTAILEGRSMSREKEAEYMLDSYSRMMERQARELEKEKKRVESLLLNIMPRSVYEELRDFGTTSPQAFDAASVLLLDFAGFTDMAISRDPAALIAELNDIFSSFDRIVEHFHCERIKTIGDGYMAVAGIPEPDPEHAIHLARVALRMRRFLERRNRTAPHRWRCRIGIGCGPVIGSMVGIRKYVYDIFGPAVNMAARLEHLCEPMQILVCGDTCERIRDEFVVRSLGEIEIKGMGVREIFALEDEARPGR
jgi:adenylate cyclase